MLLPLTSTSTLTLALTLACDSSPTPHPRSGPLPTRYSALTAELADDAEPYTPRYPLWTDGLDKTRLRVGDDVYLKTLSDGDRPLETRVLIHRADGWQLAAYLWDADGADATLTDGAAPTPVPDSDHVIPSQRQCRACHESAPSPILGDTPMQRGDVPLLPAADAKTRAAIGWVLGNCTHCHNGGDGPAAAFDLRPDVFAANTTCVPTEGSMSAIGLRVVPGDPDASVLYRAAAHLSDVAAMPPLGVTHPDPAGLAALRAYIEALPYDPGCEQPEGDPEL